MCSKCDELGGEPECGMPMAMRISLDHQITPFEGCCRTAYSLRRNDWRNDVARSGRAGSDSCQDSHGIGWSGEGVQRQNYPVRTLAARWSPKPGWISRIRRKAPLVRRGGGDTEPLRGEACRTIASLRGRRPLIPPRGTDFHPARLGVEEGPPSLTIHTPASFGSPLKEASWLAAVWCPTDRWLVGSIDPLDVSR